MAIDTEAQPRTPSEINSEALGAWLEIKDYVNPVYTKAVLAQLTRILDHPFNDPLNRAVALEMITQIVYWHPMSKYSSRTIGVVVKIIMLRDEDPSLGLSATVRQVIEDCSGSTMHRLRKALLEAEGSAHTSALRPWPGQFEVRRYVTLALTREIERTASYLQFDADVRRLRQQDEAPA